MNIIEVKFDGLNNKGFFINDGFNLNNNMNVIVESDRGLLLGQVINIFEDTSKFSNLELGRVIKIATKKDYYTNKNNKKKSVFALEKCVELVKKNNLPMKILDASYNFDQSQLMFRFVADERVDFRNLAKELGSIFKTRIELRQVGIRDKAKEVSGIGPCGRILCCSSFLTSFDSITISMAKNQNVSLNPSKINGVCGRLLCCLKYENDIYVDLRKEFPKVGSSINYNGENVKVISIDVLKKKIKVQNTGKKIYELDIEDL